MGYTLHRDEGGSVNVEAARYCRVQTHAAADKPRSSHPAALLIIRETRK
jgi:hypothetical protein